MRAEDRVVIIRFGVEKVEGKDEKGKPLDEKFQPFPYDPLACLEIDELLYKIAEKIRNQAAVYVCNIRQVTDFNGMYELYDPWCVMFFHHNKHIMCDFGTGNNNKLNFHLPNKQDLVDIVERIYEAAAKGRGLATLPTDYSTKLRG